MDGPGVTFALIAVAITGISFSAPLVVAITVPALAVAFWRNAFGAIAQRAVRLRPGPRGVARPVPMAAGAA